VSDFLIDFRKHHDKNMFKAVEMMRYFDNIKVNVYGYEKFTLVLSRCDDWNIWSPYKSLDDNTFIALSGRIALESKEWEQAKEEKGGGGLACKAIYKMYKSGGIDNLRNLNGNYVVIVYDSIIHKVYIIIDRCGMYPCFEARISENEWVLCSHPDLLAKVIGMSQDWDMTSIAEFLISGTLSFPYSYYKGTRALDFGCIHTFDLKKENTFYEGKKKYFNFDFIIDENSGEWNLAEELGEAMKKAVNRRTLSIFGQSAISLSGGLDSRGILCSADNREQLVAFCFFDEENLEYRTASHIAKEVGVKFIPLRRSFEYYGENAEMGVTISGGMGNFGNNHYLGFRNLLSECGITNILTGCYFDYLFKGLALNKRVNRYSGTERLTSFQPEYYHPHLKINSKYANAVEERLHNGLPGNTKNTLSNLENLEIERKRIFPLYYEADNMQRVIPQRVMPWYLPIVDNDIINIYLRIPPKWKINTSIFSKMVSIQCGKKISNIVNSNTGAKVNASRINLIFQRYNKALKTKIKGRKKNIVTDGSWPNWQYYLNNSEKINSLWMHSSKQAEDVLNEILGQNHRSMEFQGYRGNKLDYFLRLLTLKLWLNQRF